MALSGLQNDGGLNCCLCSGGIYWSCSFGEVRKSMGWRVQKKMGRVSLI